METLSNLIVSLIFLIYVVRKCCMLKTTFSLEWLCEKSLFHPCWKCELKWGAVLPPTGQPRGPRASHADWSCSHLPGCPHLPQSCDGLSGKTNRRRGAVLSDRWQFPTSLFFFTCFCFALILNATSRANSSVYFPVTWFDAHLNIDTWSTMYRRLLQCCDMKKGLSHVWCTQYTFSLCNWPEARLWLDIFSFASYVQTKANTVKSPTGRETNKVDQKSAITSCWILYLYNIIILFVSVVLTDTAAQDEIVFSSCICYPLHPRSVPKVLFISQFYEGYGQTECTGGCTITVPGDWSEGIIP